jgi:DNA helicase-2/ATP-dependent DNA helicase PcrA
VLFRTSHHSGPLEVELVRRNIPFVKFGGLKFLDSAHVKDLLAVLRFAQNPADRVSGFRVLQLLPGVGAGTAETILDAMAAGPDPGMGLTAVHAPKKAAADWPDFVAMFMALRQGRPGWPGELEATRRWCDPHLERMHEDAAVRRADLLQLEQIAAGYASREFFLTEITLDPPSATGDHAGVPHRDEDYLILSTIHSAKGQEWKKVYVLNCVDGCIPSDLATGSAAEIEEERRLFYVAMTRARDALHLVVPQRFHVHGQQARGDRHVYAARTRFIPETILTSFEPVTWPTTPIGSGERSTSRSGQSRDLKARMRGMWQ